jgi:L-alanine-DL-glutamate epimerase-like enolase superfamily enzyme
VRATRAAVGEEFVIMADLNQWWRRRDFFLAEPVTPTAPTRTGGPPGAAGP